MDLRWLGEPVLRAELGHGRGTDSRQLTRTAPLGSAGSSEEVLTNTVTFPHRGDGPQVDHKEDPLQILIQSHLSWLAGRRDNGTFAEWFLRARPGVRGHEPLLLIPSKLAVCWVMELVR